MASGTHPLVEDKFRTGGHAFSHTVVTNYMTGGMGDQVCDFQNLHSTANKPQLFLDRNA